MKSSVKKMAVATAAVALAGASLSGCTSGADSGGGGEESQTLTWVSYTGGAAGEKFDELIADFEAANPGVTVNREIVPGDDTYDNLISTRIQGGEAPDIFDVLNGMPGLLPYVNADMVLDVSDQPWVGDLLPAVAGASLDTDGKTYTMITTLSANGVFYDKAVFEELGLSVPTDNDEFLEVIEAVKGAGITPLASGAKDGWPLMVHAQVMAASLPAFAEAGNETAAGLADGSIKFSENDEWIDVVNGFQELIDAGAFSADASGITWPSSAIDFATGKAAMLVQGDFALPAITEANPDLDLGYFAYPYVDAGDAPTVATSNGGMLTIPQNAKNPELAKKLFDFLAEPENMAKYLTTAGALPTLEGVEPELNPAVQEILPALQAKAGDVSQSGLNPATTAALQAGLQAMLAGNGSPEQVLADMDQAQLN